MPTQSETNLEKAEALFNALPDFIVRFDRQLRPVYANSAAERVVGRLRSELDHFLAETFANAKSAETLLTFDLGDGRRVYVVRTVPELDENGWVKSVVAIARDVTESEMYRSTRADADRLRRLQEMTAAFSKAPTARDVARVLVSHAHEALRADRAMVMLLDESRQNLELAASVGYPPKVVEQWKALSVNAVGPLLEAVKTGVPLLFSDHKMVLERYPSLAQHRHPDDEALAAIPLIFKGRTLGAVAIVFRTPRQFTEAERAFIVSLTHHSAQAMDRARLLEAERAARREAETANTLKDEFLATMSHELRTPLNAVMGWTALLRGKMMDPVALRRGVDAIDRNTRTLARLVEDTLDVSRIISGKLRLEMTTVDLGGVVSAAVDVIRPAAEAKRIDIVMKVEDPCVISADAARLQQIVWNLVSNAVKFTAERGRVDVSVRRAGPNAAIEVRDTGSGITPEFLPHVFERFRQFDGSTTRKQGGLGLGLAIVRHLVELHGGTVAAESEGQDRGSIFRVEVPSRPLDETALKDASAEPRQTPTWPLMVHNLRGLRLLVVDDDEDSREILRTALEQCGAEVFSAASADTAIAQAHTVRPDVLVCDIGMPDTDGYALLRQWRTLPENAGQRTLAVAVTGFARSDDVSRTLEAGFHAHLAKPLDLARFTETIAKLTGRIAV